MSVHLLHQNLIASWLPLYRKGSIWEVTVILWRLSRKIFILSFLFSPSSSWLMLRSGFCKVCSRSYDKGILSEMSLTVVNACILPCMKRYKINIGFSHIQNVFIQYLSFQSDYKVGWGFSLAFGSRNLKYCHIIQERKSDVLIYKPQANVCLWIIDQGFQNKIS